MKSASLRTSRGLALAVGCTLLSSLATATAATARAPWWKLEVRSSPAVLPVGGEEGRIIVVATNLGDAPVEAAAAPVTVADKLPAGLVATAIRGFSGEGPLEGGTEPRQYGEVSCSLAELSCKYAGTLPIYQPLQIEITVHAAHPLTGSTEAAISGGATPSAAASAPVNAQPSAMAQFGVERFELSPEEEGGEVDRQAGSHPFQLTASLALNTTLAREQIAIEPGVTVEGTLVHQVALTKDLRTLLPPGLVGDASAFPKCSELQFYQRALGSDRCPASSAVGIAAVSIALPKTPFHNIPRRFVVPVFNLAPANGEPARFGFMVEEVPVLLDTSVRTGSDYGVTVSVENASQKAGLLNSQVTLWGVPGDPRHDAVRGLACLDETEHKASPQEILNVLGEGCAPTNETQPPAFITLPTSCVTPLRSSIQVDSWAQPSPNAPVESVSAPDLTGCNRLPFEPSVSLNASTAVASSPSGLTVELHLPQQPTLAATGLAESDLRSTTLTLPAGMTVNPSSAAGLLACSQEQVGFLGEEPASGSLQFSAADAACPDASKLATVAVRTPLLATELKGALYLAAQGVNPFGSLIALYLVARDPVSGVEIKLPGEVTLDERTGQLTTTFTDTPQLPFEDLEVRLFAGEGAVLSTPPHCGRFEAQALFTPWSGNPPEPRSPSLEVNSGTGGSPCPTGLPFAPSLSGGSTSATSGAFTSFTTTFSRPDGNQNLASVTLHTPPGLLGKLASVQPCAEPQASLGTCPSASEIGHTLVSVGLGNNPYTIAGGMVFITGPYHGAPYGLSVAEPAKAGPFDLGSGPCDCVVVRARIDVDPHTSALTVTSDPLPTMLQGIPLQLKHVNVTIDRPDFIFNPTNCSQLQITSTITGEQGATASPAVPFEVANCATLPFKPSFAVRTQAKTSKANGAALTVSLKSSFGEANTAKVRVALPKQLPSRLTTLQKACLAGVFDANPASCPPASIVGTASAVTPVLNAPLHGPAYLVSHGGAAFPDLEIVLQGEGVTLILDGQTAIKKGITTSSFASVPDAPVASFTLSLPEGPHSALAAHGNLCKGKLLMPTTITGQNGAVMAQSTRLAVSGCPKHKHNKRHRRHKHTRRP